MSADTQTGDVTRRRPLLVPWQSGVLGGILGAVVFGAFLSLQRPAALRDAIPQLYGLDPGAGALGWVLHVSHGAVLGVVFVAVVGSPTLDSALDDNLRNALAGLGYAALAWLLLWSLVLPVWVGAVSGASRPVPDLAVEPLVGHLAYGVVLGLTYSVLTD